MTSDILDTAAEAIDGNVMFGPDGRPFGLGLPSDGLACRYVVELEAPRVGEPTRSVSAANKSGNHPLAAREPCAYPRTFLVRFWVK
jgi:hypothetical protein